MNTNFRTLTAAVAFTLTVASAPALASDRALDASNAAEAQIVIALDDTSPARAPANLTVSTDGSGRASNNPASPTVGAASSLSIFDDLEIATGLDLQGPARHFHTHDERLGFTLG